MICNSVEVLFQVKNVCMINKRVTKKSHCYRKVTSVTPIFICHQKDFQILFLNEKF